MFKKYFPQKYIFKAFDTVVHVVHLALDVGEGLCPIPLVGMGPGPVNTSPTPKSH